MADYDQAILDRFDRLENKVDSIEKALVVLTRLEVEREHQRETNDQVWRAIRESQVEIRKLTSQSGRNAWSMGLWEKFLGVIIAAGLGAFVTWWTTKE